MARTRKTDLEILVRARSYIATPDQWCQHVLIDPDGRHCAIGAVAAAVANKPHDPSVDAWKMTEKIEPLIRKLEAHLPPSCKTHPDARMGWSDLSWYNNNRSHSAVLHLFDKAIAAEKK